MVKRITYLFCFLFIAAFSVKAELPDSLINLITIKESDVVKFNISNGKSEGKLRYFDPKWLLINEDKSSLKFGNRSELNYKIISGYPEENARRQEKNQEGKKTRIFDESFKGIAWYKCYFKIPKDLLHKVFKVEFILHGAVEIYLDGYLEASAGEINADPNLAEELNVTDGHVYFSLADTSVHCIAIRFGLPNFKEYSNNYPDILQAPSFNLSMPELEENNNTMLSIYYSITNMLSAFFFSLFIIHFLIYFFYREQFFNLLYSLFLILLSLTFLENYLVQFIEDLKFYLWLENIDDVVFPTVCFILVTLLNRLLNERRSWHYVLLCAAIIYHYLDVLFIGEYSFYTSVSIVMYTYFNTMAHSIKGVRRKVASAKFLGWGILSCTLSIVLLFVITFVIAMAGISLNNDVWAFIIFGFLIIVSILSIPISMSAYLAYDFANTNRSLSKKLIEVEELSAKNIEQEKEKQRILSEQNAMLETQVKERTKEIEEQKKVIEEKNKDITDSINYAQRIQRSILPSDHEIKDIFADSFVLFKPRDIVSGDFFQFKKVDHHRFAIMADCTGHGVPGALMSMIGSNLLHQIIVERQILQPNRILAELHKEVRATLRQTSGVQSHDGMDASIALVLGNKLFISSANRPVVMINNGVLTEIKPTKRSIGGSSGENDVEFELHEFEVIPGQMLYMFSDGYADQFGGDTGKKMKVKNLVNMLVDNHQLPVIQQLQILDHSFVNWKGALEQVDDVCLIGIRM